MNANTSLFKRLLSTNAGWAPLALRLPVTAATDSVTSEFTRMFVRLSLMSQGSKLPLAIPPLPTRAPRSPYQLTGATAALDVRKEEGP